MHEFIVCSVLYGTGGIILIIVMAIHDCTPLWGWWWCWRSGYFLYDSFYEADEIWISPLQFLHHFVYECWCNAFEKLLFCITFRQPSHEDMGSHIQHHKPSTFFQFLFKLLWITTLHAWQLLVNTYTYTGLCTHRHLSCCGLKTIFSRNNTSNEKRYEECKGQWIHS